MASKYFFLLVNTLYILFISTIGIYIYESITEIEHDSDSDSDSNSNYELVDNDLILNLNDTTYTVDFDNIKKDTTITVNGLVIVIEYK
jgi:hypothetical protein